MLKITTPPAAVPEALDPASMVTVLGAAASEESRIQEIIQDATRVAEDIARRRLWYREYTEVFTGDGEERLYLEARPVASVTSIALGDDDALVEGNDADEYEIFPWGLYRQDRWTDACPTKWRCRYFGGYWLPSMGAAPGSGEANIAIDGRHVRRAVELMVKATYDRYQQEFGVKRDRIGGEAPIEVEYFQGVAVPDEARQILENLQPIAS